MKMSTLVGKRTREMPRDAELVSHQFLVRGGYIKQLASGIFSLLPLGKRIALKVEKIIREEMNRIEGQEVTMPVVMPAEIWKESGRYDAIGSEMARFEDRTGAACVLGMTHEEAVVHMVRADLTSYKQLPAMVYQIQTKFRDEPRSRGGLIRVREFTMKDAYSFHSSQDSLADTYQSVLEAYRRIYERCGLTQIIEVESDSGMMGGKIAHEFMYVNPCGEDSLVLGVESGYRANKEVARTYFEYANEEALTLEEVHTPESATIEEVANYLGISQDRTCKIILMEEMGEKKLVAILLRGDRQLNELQVQKTFPESKIRFAEDELIRATGIEPGFGSLQGVDLSRVHVLIDESIVDCPNLVVGANRKDWHLKNWNFKRDLNSGKIDQFSFVQEGDFCPDSSERVELTRGVEVGNTFQLGTRYSESMTACYLDQNGKAKPFIMGCYGIGVGRLMACLIEEHHDKWGPVWPESVAPFDIHLCLLDKRKEEIEAKGFELYEKLIRAGLEVLIDDRDEKAGSQFADADLIGTPLRVVLSAKTVKNGEFELSKRASKERQTHALESAVEVILEESKKNLKTMG
jgi:prolyl-tRNA synthetase